MLQAVLNKAKRWGLYGGKHPLELELAKICDTADIELFKKVINDCNHVLYDLLPPKRCMVTTLGHDLASMFYASKTFMRTRIFWTECK